MYFWKLVLLRFGRLKILSFLMKDYQYAFIEEILVHLALQVVVE